MAQETLPKSSIRVPGGECEKLATHEADKALALSPPWWYGGLWAATMFGSGAFIGYRMQLKESGPSAADLDAALKAKPHPFLQTPRRAAPVPLNAAGLAVRGEYIYCTAPPSRPSFSCPLLLLLMSLDFVCALPTLKLWGSVRHIASLLFRSP